MQSQRGREIGRGDGRQAGYAAQATDHVGRGAHGGWSDQSTRSLAFSKKKKYVKIAKLASEEEEKGSFAPSSRLLLSIVARGALMSFSHVTPQLCDAAGKRTGEEGDTGMT